NTPKAPLQPLTGAALIRYDMQHLRTVARTTAEFDKWHPVKVLYHYMRLRAHQFIPETRKLVELLQNHPLSALPITIREGHEGRLQFVKRCWEENVKTLTEAGIHSSPEIGQDWIMVDVSTKDGKMWDELEDHGKKKA
ncbi:MAG: hypothetical protein LQ338_008259, partial [Usnochroma carphineum]